MFKRSCEDPNRVYICLFGRRYIFDKTRAGLNKYVGWYKP